VSQSSDSRYINFVSRLDLRSYILRKCFDVTRVPLAALPPNRDRFSDTSSIAPIIEEIPLGMPHLTLSQIFSALTYYSDHLEEINAYIERNRIPDDLIDPLLKNS